MLSSTTPPVLFDFTAEADVRPWRVVDDGVMGGRSSGGFRLNDEGHGVFAGRVSLENNGGFSSVRYRCPRTAVEGATKVVLRVRGDGKSYQFRVKADADDYYSYVHTFETSGAWEEVEIPLADMHPAFRGRKLNQPNFDRDAIEEIALLIGNKRAETFELLIDKIELR